MHNLKRGLLRLPALILSTAMVVTCAPVTSHASDIVSEENISSFEYESDGNHICDLFSGYEVIDQASDLDNIDLELLSKSKGTSGGDLVIVVDPGHDAVHRGASGTNTYGITYWEEDLNFTIAKGLYDKLSTQPGVKVYMTRQGAACPYPDSPSAAVCNASRVNFAQSVNADLYVACHLNTSTSKTGMGSEVYYPNSNFNEVVGRTGKNVADAILKALTNLGLMDRGTKTRNSSSTLYPDNSAADYYTVIKNSKDAGFTGIIIEHAFLDSLSDFNNYLSTDEKLRRLGEADADGIINKLGAIREAVNVGITTPVFSSTFYYQNNPDLQQVFEASDHEGLLAHFEANGMDEGRLSSPLFSVRGYRNTYPELRAMFKGEWRKYYEHYLNEGMALGMKGDPNANDMVGYTTVYNGVDYSAVYNLNDYREYNFEELRSIRFDDEKMIEHFVTVGMKKGYESSKEFSAMSYFFANPDLRQIFKKDWVKYYQHYMEYGKSEGRTAIGVEEMQGGITVYNGFDYKDIYDYAYYIRKYPDLREAYIGDEEGLLSHFVNLGMKEGRIASPNFNVRYYKETYTDLQAVFGDNYEPYFNHWLTAGMAEGRNGVEPVKNTTESGDLYTIMGTTNYGCTVDKMKAYFLKYAEFPTYYAEMGDEINTLEAFCQAYLDECRIEGVKAEVAFTQAMMETSFLRFTGSVSISKYNFAGIGATSTDAVGYQFNSVREGIRVHVQHLKAYGSDEALFNEQVDPRFQYVKRKSAEYVEYLGIQENPTHAGWASQENYGYNIMKRVREWLNV